MPPQNPRIIENLRCPKFLAITFNKATSNPSNLLNKHEHRNPKKKKKKKSRNLPRSKDCVPAPIPNATMLNAIITNLKKKKKGTYTKRQNFNK